MGSAEQLVVGGVDTHKDFHVAAALDVQGRCRGSQTFAASARGYTSLLSWLRRYGEVVCVGVEGTGSWGAGLSRHLRDAGVSVIDVNRPSRQLRRQRGKSDPVDAEAAARAVLGGHATVIAKRADGRVECIRLLRVARRGALKARTQASLQLHAVLDTGPEAFRARFLGLSQRRLVNAVAHVRPGQLDDPAGAVRFAAASIAARWLALDEEVQRLTKTLEPLVRSVAPTLCEKHGIGFDTAGALLAAAGDNSERLHSEAAFAALCGASPVEASSGKIKRHRLNRGGNREANSALWRIVLVRLKSDPRSRAYLERRTSEGKNKREIMRCLKRYVAREAYLAIRQDVGVTKVRVDSGDDDNDLRGRLNPVSRLFGEVTPGPVRELTTAARRGRVLPSSSSRSTVHQEERH